MIAIESFKRFRSKDIIAIALFSFLFYIISKIIKPHPQYTFILTLALFILLMTFTVFLIRKAGTATFFALLSSILTIQNNNLDLTGLDKIVLLTSLGLLFEIFFLILKLEIKLLPLDVILGASFSSLLTPIILSLTLSNNISSNLINFSLLTFFIGLASSTIAFLIWYNLKTTKLILKFEYMK